MPEVPEEEDRPAREGQEEEGGDVQRPPGPEEGRQGDIEHLQSDLYLSCCVEPISIINHFEFDLAASIFYDRNRL